MYARNVGRSGVGVGYSEQQGPEPVLFIPPLMITVEIDMSASADPFPMLKLRVAPPRSSVPKLVLENRV